MRLKIGDKIEGIVEGVDDKGRGELKVEGKAALAYFVIPGEKISGEIVARAGGRPRIKVDAILEPSPDRVVPRCPDAGRCGGCPLQMVNYERQCKLKLNLVKQAFAEEEITKNQEPNSKDFINAKSQYYYRNRMDYVFAVDGSLGLKTPEHWDMVLNLSSCLMLSPDAIKVMEIVRNLTKESGAPFWNNRTHAGFWRYLVIREGKNTGERLILITTSAELSDLPLREKFAAALKPYATSLLWGINPEITDLSIPKTIRTIFGDPYLTEKVNDFVYQIPATSFFQTNTEMAAVLQNTVVEFAAPKREETILDLYCGNGFLSFALARKAKQVIGIEIDEPSIEIARTNANLNNITNALFFVGATESLLPATLSRDNPDCIVLDPPRAGLHPAALDALMGSSAKRLVYVSCNPRALAHDLKTLLTAYDVERSHCIDLFPHTPHIETVVSLKLTNAK